MGCREPQDRQQVVPSDRQRYVLRVESAVGEGNERLRHLMEQHVLAGRAGHGRVAEQGRRDVIEHTILIEQEWVGLRAWDPFLASGNGAPGGGARAPTARTALASHLRGMALIIQTPPSKHVWRS